MTTGESSEKGQMKSSTDMYARKTLGGRYHRRPTGMATTNVTSNNHLSLTESSDTLEQEPIIIPRIYHKLKIDNREASQDTKVS